MYFYILKWNLTNVRINHYDTNTSADMILLADTVLTHYIGIGHVILVNYNWNTNTDHKESNGYG